MAAEGRRGRAKRVTDPLDDKVKARLRGDGYCFAGYVSSGSEHDGGDLSGFVDGFFFSVEEDDDGGVAAAAGGGEGDDDDAGSVGSEREGERSAPPVPVVAMVQDLLKPPVRDRFRRDLAAKVAEAEQRLGGLRSNRAAFRRAVMGSLRESGYNAGICKARWESSGGISAGSYEYIDVVSAPPESSSGTPPSHQQQRYIVDVEFAAEFEIARPTSDYGRVAGELPRVYVGRAEELKRLLRLLADAAKRSLRAREMHVPPWRKSRYMQAKWLGPYRRTVNPVPSSSSTALAGVPPPSFAPVGDVKCRCVGFDATARLVFPPATSWTR